MSGPLLDRIDIHIEVPAVPYRDLAGRDAGEASETVRGRVLEARSRQAGRFEGGGVVVNARMSAKQIRRYCAVEPDGTRLLETAVSKLGLSARAYTRILKVSRTIADLEGAEKILAAHVAEAIQYRGLDRTAL